MSDRASTVYGVSESIPVRNSRLMNPYAVGHARRNRATIPDHLRMLQDRVHSPSPGKPKHHPKRCDHCVDHQLEGTTDQQLAALGEHHDRYPAEVAKARKMTREAMAAKERAELERDSSREQVAAALKSRDRHRGIHEAVIAQHFPTDDGSCTCGQRFPCSTVEAVEAARVRFRDPEERI